MSKQINLMFSDGVAVQVMADVDIDIYEHEDVSQIHIADAIYNTVLEKLKEADASLQPGPYTVRLMATIVAGEKKDAVSASDY